MLTMTTLMGSVLNRLAETSYIKWIEFWLIFTQFVPFAQVILITIIEALRHREEVNEKRQRQEDTEEIVMERSPEVYEMIVGGKKVKVERSRKLFLPLIDFLPGPPSFERSTSTKGTEK